MIYGLPPLTLSNIDWLNKEIEYFFRNLETAVTKKRWQSFENYLSPSFVQSIKPSPKLSDLFRGFFTEFKRLEIPERVFVINSYRSSQEVEEFLSSSRVDRSDIVLENLPNRFVQATRNLFKHLFTSTLNRDNCLNKHYEDVWKNLQSREIRICPFCGIEELLPPELYRQDYDHLLCQSEYPMLAIASKNLVPSGRDCNQIFKKATDVIWIEGSRSVFPYPYADIAELLMTLENEQLDFRRLKGNWKIQFFPNQPSIQSWIYVFKINERIKTQVLDARYVGWLKESAKMLLKNDVISKKDWRGIACEFRRLSDVYWEIRLSEPLYYVRSAYFRFLSELRNPSTINGVLNYLDEAIQK